MMWTFRFLASVLLLIAVIALVNDATRSRAADRMVTTSAGEQWAKLAPASLKAAQGAVQRYSHPWVWDGAFAKLLLAPTWALLGGLGLVFAYAGRRRRRVNVFAN